MKHFCLITCLVIAVATSGQEVFHLQKINDGGVTLDKGWKFHPGDGPAWSTQVMMIPIGKIKSNAGAGPFTTGKGG